MWEKHPLSGLDTTLLSICGVNVCTLRKCGNISVCVSCLWVWQLVADIRWKYSSCKTIHYSHPYESSLLNISSDVNRGKKENMHWHLFSEIVLCLLYEVVQSWDVWHKMYAISIIAQWSHLNFHSPLNSHLKKHLSFHVFLFSWALLWANELLVCWICIEMCYL